MAVIDPGPILDSHRDALAAALEGERVTAICVTHCHSDHSPLAAWLHAETGAPTIAFGPHPPPDDGDESLAEEIADGVKVEESIDLAFDPDVRVTDGDLAAAGPGWTITAVHTPGHTSNHTCFAFAEERVLFPGDHVMGWSTTVVSPPDGDMAAYVESLRKVGGRADHTYWPTHGPAIADPQRYVGQLVAHRLERERQIVDAVRSGRRRDPRHRRPPVRRRRQRAAQGRRSDGARAPRRSSSTTETSGSRAGAAAARQPLRAGMSLPSEPASPSPPI